MPTNPLYRKGSVIAVPIHLDALLVVERSRVTPAMADFTRLPFFDGERDINGQLPWLGGTAATEAFGDSDLLPGSSPLVLEKGIHLHWTFPKALTTGILSGDGRMVFPHLPDRWLVARSHGVGGKQVIEDQWVIESDY